MLALVMAAVIALAVWPSSAPSAAAQDMPAPVPGVSATADGSDSITVSWNAVTSTCGNNSLYYEVRWDDDSGFASPQDEDFIPTTTGSYRITGLQEGTPYFVQVRAVCADFLGFVTLEGAWSVADSATTELQAPAQVAGVIADATSDVEIMVSWMMAIRAGAYVVQWREDGQAFDPARQAAVNALTYDVTGLTADTRYYFQVIATRAGATDAVPSDEAGASTDAAPTPVQVAGVMATAISDSEIQVEWNVAQHATGYLAQWRQDGEAFDSSREAVVSGAGVVIEYLRAETEYFVRVIGTRAYAANGPASAADSATTGQARFKVWSDRFPGGALAAQLALAAFGGALSGVKFRRMKSPMREAAILIVICLASLILPIMGVGNIFWTGGIALLIALSSIAVIFLASRH